VNVYGDASTVVDYGYGIVYVNGDIYAVAITGQSFVNRVVDYFVDQMMKSQFAR
jgi:hypothetical protein